jgi:four helix bundle protein
MGLIKSYRDLVAWQKAMSLAKKIYVLTRSYPKEELYGITSQMRRAAVSVPANIAEGRSRNHKKEFAHFLGFAKGSLAELQTFLMLSIDLGYAGPSKINGLMQDSEELERILTSLVFVLSPRT